MVLAATSLFCAPPASAAAGPAPAPQARTFAPVPVDPSDAAFGASLPALVDLLSKRELTAGGKLDASNLNDKIDALERAYEQANAPAVTHYSRVSFGSGALTLAALPVLAALGAAFVVLRRRRADRGIAA